MGKCCFHASSFIFNRVIIKVAGNPDRHKSSVEFASAWDQTTHFGVTCPWVTKISHFLTWISLKPVGQSWSNFMCSIIGVGERLHKVLGQIGSKLWFPWQQNMHKISDEFEFRPDRTIDYGGLKISHRRIMGKWCLHASSFIFDRIIIKVAGNHDRHKSSGEFDFGPLVSIAHLYVFWNGRMSSSACGWSKDLFVFFNTCLIGQVWCSCT